ETPVYDSEGARVGNRREYTSVVFAGAEPLGTGHGASKQEAEQDAARAALESLVGSVKEMPAAKPARPRTRRAPRQQRETATAAAAQPASEAEVVPLHARPEPRSRQFGEPTQQAPVVGQGQWPPTSANVPASLFLTSRQLLRFKAFARQTEIQF